MLKNAALFLGVVFWLTPWAGASIVPIFPGPDIPVFDRGVEYALGWWTTPGIFDVRIDLLYQGSLEYTIAASTPNDGKYLWQVPQTQHLNSDYTFRISDVANNAESGLSGEFGVGRTEDGYGYFQITSPFDGTQNALAYQGHPFTVSWTTGLTSSMVNVELWYMDTREAVLGVDQPNTGLFTWNVPAGQHLNSDYRIIVVDAADARYKGATSEFSVAPEPSALALLFVGVAAMLRKR